jgi:hypothetical protein
MTSSGGERRKFIRIGYDMPLEFTTTVMDFGTPRLVNFEGLGVDICDRGLGFMTEFNCKPRLFIVLKQEDGSFQNAEVRWVGELDGKLRVGVLFYNE